MTLTTTTVDRLVFIRQLSLKGMEESRQAFPMSGAAILTLHNAVELFFVLAAEKAGAQVKTNTNFMAYFDLINQALAPKQLNHKPSIGRLNTMRSALKHSGVLPAPEEIERARNSVADFFDDNTPLIFSVEFAAISLLDLVENERAKQLLQEAEDYLASDDAENAIVEIAHAHKVLWRGVAPQDHSLLRHGMGRTGDRHFDHIEKSLEVIFESVWQLESMVTKLVFGIDQFKSAKFASLVPAVLLSPFNDESRQVQWLHGKRPPSLVDCRWCFDFVVDIAIRMQRATSINSM